jgi:Ca-activated chloride channel family protein
MPDAKTAVTAGLFQRNASEIAVPLAGVSIHAEIAGACGRVTVTQRYVNRETTAIEAVYLFPLDERAAVCGFEAIVDGTLVVGEVQERDQAFETYDDALERGHGAFLLDEERPDVFQASIGNLPAGKEVLVKITYVTELSVEGGQLQFVVPTTVAPRDAPAQDQRGVGRPQAEALAAPTAGKVPYGLDLSVRVTMPGRVTCVESTSHPISVTIDESTAAVSLATARAALDRDFLLSIGAEGMNTPQAIVERDDEGRETIGVSFVPVFHDAAAPAEVIFLVDRSGSMLGDSIEEVRNALQLCLRSMTPGCWFNIIGFGSRHVSLFPESRAYDEGSLRAATEHVASLDADLGGTEILPALAFVLEQAARSGLPRQVVVLTDGEVTNTDAVLSLAARHAASARIFTFGIGAAASRHLVSGLARAGGGAAEFIHPGERIEPKVVRQLGRLLSPAVTDVILEWVGGEVKPAPLAVPPVFAGSRLLAYGLVGTSRPAAVRLSGNGPSGPLSFEIPLSTIAVTAGRTVGTLAARARIRELEESGDWTGVHGSRQKNRRRTVASREIVELSLKYSLISRETSFVAVERRETPVTGEMNLRRVPIALPAGWGGVDQRRPAIRAARVAMPSMSALDMSAVDVSAPDAAPASGRVRRAIAHAFGASGSGGDTAQAPEGPGSIRPEFWADVPSSPPSVPSQSSDPERAAMHLLVALQHADGHWDLTADLAALLGVDLDRLEAAIAMASGEPSDIRRAWATALAIAWLEAHASGVEDEWRLLAAKGRQWVDNVPASPQGRWTWVDAARKFMAA